MAPASARRRKGMAAQDSTMGARKLISTMAATASGATFSRSPRLCIPALLITTFTWPNLFSAFLSNLIQPSESATSIATVNTSEPWARSSLAILFRPVRPLATSTSFELSAANARAQAAPTPAEAPVITTVLPAKFLFIVKPFYSDFNFTYEACSRSSSASLSRGYWKLKPLSWTLRGITR